VLTYSRSAYPVRREVEEAQQRAWARLAKPGTWWTGAERVAIARETRNARTCRVCAERKNTVSPFAVAGAHDSDTSLSATIIDVAHRVTTDPGRLSRKWFQGVLAAGIDDVHYVEALGVIVRTVAIDNFCIAIGAPLHPLPAPEAGQPTRVRPANVADEGFWVPVQPQGSELYGEGIVPNVARALSLVPEEVRAMFDVMPAHYVPMEHVPDATYDAGRAISRAQMELVAARVSAVNECFY
jgi:hypothetical protein